MPVVNEKRARRRGSAAVAVLIAVALAAVGIYSFWDDWRATPHTTSDFLMNTFVSQTVYGKNAQRAADEVVAALSGFEDDFSMYRENSPIAQINRSAGVAPVAVPEQVYQLIATAYDYCAQTDGLFDVTTGPLSVLWNVTGDTPHVPGQQELSQALELVDYRDILLDPEARTVMLRRPGQMIDLGAIAKGYACRVAGEIYRRYQVGGAVLSVGGNIYTYGKKPGGGAYDIGLSTPEKDRQHTLGTLHADGMVVATSGGYERYFEEQGIRYHHIFDPRTGYPSQQDLLSLTVVAEDGALADFLSTYFFVAGSQAAIDCLDRSEFSLILVDSEKNVYISPALKDQFALTSSDYTLAAP